MSTDRHDTPPCAELHVHVEGTLEPDLIYALAERNAVALPYRDIDDLRRRYEFEDLSSFLDLYYANMAVLQTADDFADLATAYFARAAAGGVRHVDLFFDPQAHLVRGVALATVVEGLGRAIDEAAERFDLTVGLIACFLRDRSPEEALAVLRDLLSMDAGIIGVGLDSAERGNPPALFEEVFALAAANGLRRVAHAGEEGPAAYVAEALDVLGIERVDHGIRSIEDPRLLARLAAEGVALTVCPLSNVRLRAVATMADHPLPQLIAAGVRVTVNSDDPAYFGGYVDDNYRALADVFGWGPAELAALARHSATASFASPEGRQRLLDEIDEWERRAVGV
ncbi:adenosine deaminase [Microbacterium sp. SORGH_AS_0888]|uniref:adenosine deaminase n=1 Tax=Microbacterium sp. SORGH_AS_0888 TaxID=3041791 RepID=UPI00277ECB07|nr:adenosine deaminase [Microbacterium sp. SORGH_AS_0888]MDQ1129432.1 adenosine deaminase [Microbacterium sp. SORGH_AS_0888]